MADIIRGNVEITSMAKLRSLALFTPRSAQASMYQAVPPSSYILPKTVTSNEIESTSDHELSLNQRRTWSSIEWINEIFGSLRRPIWLQRWFWTKTWDDVRKFPFAWLARRLFPHFLPLSVITSLLLLLILMSRSPRDFTNDTSNDLCKPDASFVLSSDDYDPWRRDSVFAISLSFGSYSFGTAKLIDFCWDVCVGRGAQAGLAVFSYRVFTKGLSRTMETSSVSHDTFKAVTVQSGTASGITVLGKDFFKNRTPRAKLAIFWTILAGVFVLVVPTWLSAMTGYTADITAYVSDRDGNLIRAANFRPVIYTIHDAERIGAGFQNNTQISVPWDSTGIQLEYDASYGCFPLDSISADDAQNVNFSIPSSTIYTSGSPTSSDWHDCRLLWAVSRYVFDYGFLAKSTVLNTTFHRPEDLNMTTLVHISPSLNISAYFATPSTINGSLPDDPWYGAPYGQQWKNPDDGQYTFNVNNPVFLDAASQTMYNLTELNAAGSCQQNGQVRYKWGFSFLLLYFFVVALLIWTIGMWVFYLDSWLHSRLDNEHAQMGVERAILDLSESMHTKLGPDQIQLRTNSQIQPFVKSNTLTYSTLPMKTLAVTRWTRFRWWWKEFLVKQWAKEEKWWLGLLTFFTLMLALSFETQLRYSWCPLIAVLPVAGVICALAAGREARSRWVLFAASLIIFLSLNIWWVKAGIYTQWFYCESTLFC